MQSARLARAAHNRHLPCHQQVQPASSGERSRTGGCLIISERRLDSGLPEGWINAEDYLRSEPEEFASYDTVINLCSSFAYLSVGYYCSLLAEARGKVAIPSVQVINDAAQGMANHVETVEQAGVRVAHRGCRIAILHDPEEGLPPSNRRALNKFIDAGKDLGVEVSLIGKGDARRLANFDALLIRETTALNHHTYWMAKQAERMGLAVIDDSQSIQRCTNKVYLAELLRTHGVPAPRTVVVQRADLARIAQIEAEIGYPMVVKVPDGAFCRGVSKVANCSEFFAASETLFAHSSMIVVQEYLYTEFDWRVGVLDRQVIFASQYYMSSGHWQVAKRDAKGHAQFGMARSVPLAHAPQDILRHALDAANLIGDGLYGVDMKMSARGPVVIEVNDNPNIDHGIEDGVLGDELYRTILASLIRRAKTESSGSPDLHAARPDAQ